MHTFLLPLILLVTTSVVCRAQASVESNTVMNIRIYAPGFSPYTGVEGSPYVPGDSVQTGWLVNQSRKIPVKLHYNSYTGEVEYLQNNKIRSPLNSVAEFVILTPDTIRFQKGFPSTGTQTANHFYQVLFDGRKTKLLRYLSATIKSNTDPMHNDFGKKTFDNREAYYVWIANGASGALAEGQMKPVTNSKKALVSLFPQYSEGLNRYLADQKLKLKTWTDFASVLGYLDKQP